ncbi:MAG: hypothetical protein WCC00_11940 [Candidatus Aminicenantales bacterium]
MKKLVVFILAAYSCGCLKAGEHVLAVSPHPDGRHAFLLVERSYVSFPDTINKEAILILDLESSSKRELYTGAIQGDPLNPLKPSPDGQSLMFNDGNRLIIQDIRSKKILLSREFESPFPMGCEWSPQSDRVCFTDSKGINVLTIADRQEDLISRPGYYGRAWSSSGEWLICSDDRGWPQGCSLVLINISSKERRPLFRASSGIITYVALMNDDAQALFVIGLIDGKDASVNILKIEDLKTEEIIRSEESGWPFPQFILTTDKTRLLSDSRDGINVLDIASGKATKVPFAFSLDSMGLMRRAFWIYDGLTDEVIIIGESGSIISRSRTEHPGRREAAVSKKSSSTFDL